MAYNKGNGSDSPMRRRGPRRRKKYVHFVLIKSMIILTTKILQN